MLLKQDKSKQKIIRYSEEYAIVELFHSVQGEGFWSGYNAFFIRLAGCDVHCPWCDQKETWSTKNYPLFTPQKLLEKLSEIKTQHIIITGGEPLLHDLNKLTQTLKESNHKLHLETSGAYALTGEFDWITLSPKSYKVPHPSIYNHVSELKVVIDNEDDIIWAESQAQKISSDIPKYLQPQWDNKNSQDLVFEYILNNPQWLLSLQTHKYLGVQ
jgi:7-carboxy-7-deazaguanine synthase